MNNLQKYQRIVDEIIEKSFPELKEKKIIIKEKTTFSYRAHVGYYPWGMQIIISHQLRKFSHKFIKRILFHELCHLEIFKKWGIIRTNLDFLFYLLSKKHRLKVEKEANILMIKKGYGKQILEVRKENLKRGLTYSLTENEIKYYIKKFKK